ncbi:TRAP transporter small permease [Castellaniella sp. GW247-6E4]|uniref:TRAP transporter small permease n=1 Tax=Castellaniella sp. GW247-6E4 TaxID=3140380 RepID=UPI0033155B86
MLKHLLDWIDLWMTRLIQVLAVAVTCIMVASLLIGVVYRYILQDSASWSDEVALLAFTWLVFLTAALMVREDGHVRIEIIGKVLSPALSFLLTQAIWLVIVFIGLFMVRTGLNFIDFTAGQTSPATRYPIWLRSSAFPVSGIFIAFYALRKLGRLRNRPSTSGNRHE